MPAYTYLSDANPLLPSGPWPLPDCSLPPAAMARQADAIANRRGTTAFIQQLARQFVSSHQLLQMLIRVQYRFGWISPHAVDALSDCLSAKQGEIRSVIDFYSFLTPVYQGRYRILFSSNITDVYAGQDENLRLLCGLLGIQEGAVREDQLISVARTSCIGLGDQGPAALVNGHPLVDLSPQRIRRMARLIEAKKPFDQWPKCWFSISDSVRLKGPLLSRRFSPGQGLSQPDAALWQQLERSNLRGRGGAGFSTYRKWLGVCEQPASEPRFIVCNADEGEPGTFKDRLLLQRCAHQVFEGMTLAARMLGARKGFVYLRAEYAYLYPLLQRQLQDRRRLGLLGDDILGAHGCSFDIEVHLGAGAYVCGEETALLESLEGRRGIPRIRPPFPAVSGYLGSPTLVNNVETFACITELALAGAEAFKHWGTQDSSGSKIHSISGDCSAPGIYELPWGCSINEVLRLCGGEGAQAVQVGGPAGQRVLADQFHRTLAFEDIATGGSFMVIGPQRDRHQLASNFSHFFAHESCGFCTPCRVGCQQLTIYIDRLKKQPLRAQELASVRRLGEMMIKTSHCGLGKTAALPILELLNDGLSGECPPSERGAQFVDGKKTSSSVTARENQEGN